jgi:hypothetical protein
MYNHFSFQALFLGVPIPTIWYIKSIQKGRKKGVKNSKEQVSDLLTSDQ